MIVAPMAGSFTRCPQRKSIAAPLVHLAARRALAEALSRLAGVGGEQELDAVHAALAEQLAVGGERAVQLVNEKRPAAKAAGLFHSDN